MCSIDVPCAHMCHVFDRSMHRQNLLRLTDMVYRSLLPTTIIHD